LRKSGDVLSLEIPEHCAAISENLKICREKLSILKSQIEERKEKLKTAKEYFALLEKSENFLKESNRALLEWSSKIPSISNVQEAEKLKSEIEMVKFQIKNLLIF
jgi:ABC-type Zn uptake system ZnuABC Zn-binding protein ZnuA